MHKHTLLKGFQFGSLLQLAIGPISVFVFNIAVLQGLFPALMGVLGVVIVDGIFIALSIVGISSFITKKERLIKVLGSIILVIFGVNIILSAIDSNSTPDTVESGMNYLSIFLKAMFLTGANPLTIVFWSGVFSAKIVEDNFERKDEILFGLGAVLSTLVWQTGISLLGQMTNRFLSDSMIMILNIIVGVILIYFGIHLWLFKKKTDKK